jgi:subtilisin-like proprotein convertase family protein
VKISQLSTLLLLACSVATEAQDALKIEKVGSDVRLTFPTEAEHYYVLRRRTDQIMPPTPPVLTPGMRPPTPNAQYGIPLGMKLGTGTQQALIDAGIITSAERAFYRLERIPKEKSLDHDSDGIPDAVELLFPVMNPLVADGHLNADSDGWTNFDEIMLFGSDPATINLHTAAPKLQGLSVEAARQMLASKGMSIRSLTLSRIVRQPATAILTPDYTGNIVPAGAAFALTAAAPTDAGSLDPHLSLFINQNLVQGSTEASDTNAQAYYQAIDPLNAKTTLQAWKSANNFGQSGGIERSAAYFNEADLGFGREMHMRADANGIFFYVTNYETVNEAATRPKRDIATVAMEYSPHPVNGGDPYVKFYTFNGNHEQKALRAQPTEPPDARINKINLDGRGDKHQPGMCMVCHGGQPKSLVNGIYPDEGRVGARFIPFDVGSFTYPTIAGFSRASQEASFKEMNAQVLKSMVAENIFENHTLLAIPDSNTQERSEIEVANLSGTITDIDVSFDGFGDANEASSYGLTHKSPNELEIGLRAPNGDYILLLPIETPLASNLRHFRFDDAGKKLIGDLSTPGNPGRWKPRDALEQFNGINPNGTWTLFLRDGIPGNEGELRHWSLRIMTSVPRADAARDLVHGWYGGPTLPNAFNQNFTPGAWQTPAALEKGGDVLYRNVFAHSCRACHIMLTDRKPYADFDRYEEFLAAGSSIGYYVFESSLMPAARRTFDKFWHSTNPSQPETLATWLAKTGDQSHIISATDVPKNVGLSAGVFGITGSTITVANAPGRIKDLNVSIDSLPHNRLSDLTLWLTAPNGQIVSLVSNKGGTGKNFENTYFDDEVSLVPGVEAVRAPFIGSYRPEGNLSTLIDLPMEGRWTLSIQDNRSSQDGLLNAWSLHFNTRGRTLGAQQMQPIIYLPSLANGGIVNVGSAGVPAGTTLTWFLRPPSESSTVLTALSGNTTTFLPDREGTYSVILTATNGALRNSTSQRILIQNKLPEITLAPVPNVTPPASANLSATVVDDMLPNGPGPILSTIWWVRSGPGSVVFADAFALNTTATFSTPGQYILGFTAEDPYGYVVKDLIVTVNGAPPSNLPPVVNAGPDQAVAGVTLPKSVILSGSATDDSLPAPPSLALTWSVLQSPNGATVNFSNSTVANPTIHCSHHGDYLLRLTATDGSLTASDDIKITIQVSLSGQITPMLTTPALDNCLLCHNNNYAEGGLSFTTNTGVLDSSSTIHARLMDSMHPERINLTNPAESQFLKFPAMGGNGMPARTGFAVGSQNYNSILLWIQQGAPNNYLSEALHAEMPQTRKTSERVRR